jgi:hypothetical protein
MLPYLSFVALNALAVCLLLPTCWVMLLIGMLLGGRDPDGGIAWGLCVLAEMMAKPIDMVRNAMIARKPVSLTFAGGVRYWRKQLVIGRDVDSKNWEPLADIARCSLRKLPKGFAFTDKSNRNFKEWRFAKYVISKRKVDA